MRRLHLEVASGSAQRRPVRVLAVVLRPGVEACTCTPRGLKHVPRDCISPADRTLMHAGVQIVRGQRSFAPVELTPQVFLLDAHLLLENGLNHPRSLAG